MKRANKFDSIAVVLAAGCSALLFVACGGGGDAGSGSPSQPTSDGGAATGDGSGAATADGGAAGSDGSAPPPVDDAGTSQSAADFEGIDLTGFAPSRVAGCDAFDSSTGALTLTLDGSTHLLVLDALGGNIRANDTVCSNPDGSTATTANVRSITVHGSAGDDRVLVDLLPGPFGAIFGSPGALAFDLAAGNDTVLVRGTRGDDAMRATAGAAGETQADLGANAACLRASNVESMLFSFGPGNDTFSGASTAPVAIALTLYGGAGDDTLQGGAANDVVNGGDGDDTIDEGSAANGADVLNGGAGNDSITYEHRAMAVTIALCGSPANDACAPPACACPASNGEANEKDTVVNFENASGGAGDDVLTGDANDNILSGRGGSDHLDGAAGQDQIYGDEGDDFVTGGGDDDILTGGPGADTIDGASGDNICLYDQADAPLKNCQTSVEQ